MRVPVRSLSARPSRASPPHEFTSVQLSERTQLLGKNVCGCFLSHVLASSSFLGKWLVLWLVLWPVQVWFQLLFLTVGAE